MTSYARRPPSNKPADPYIRPVKGNKKTRRKAVLEERKRSGQPIGKKGRNILTRANNKANRPGQPNTNPAAKPSTKPPVDPMMTQAGVLARAQIQPELSNLSADQRYAASANKNQQRQIGGWSLAANQDLQAAFDRTRNAINGVISANTASGTEGQNALASAMRTSGQQQEGLERLIGAPGTLPTDENALNASVASGRAANDRLLAQSAQGDISTAGQAAMLAPVGLSEQSDAERRRFNALRQKYQSDRAGVLGKLPGLEQTAYQGLREQARSDKELKAKIKDMKFQQGIAAGQLKLGQGQLKLSGKELRGKLSDQRFQHRLALAELNMKGRDQNFQHWLATSSLDLERQKFKGEQAINWANVGINQKNAETEFQKLAQAVKDADGAKAKERAKLRGDAYAKSLSWLSSYLEPKQGEVQGSSARNYPHAAATRDDPNTTKNEAMGGYSRLFADALIGMQQFTSKKDALRILSHSQYADWRARAKAYLAYMTRYSSNNPAHGNPVPNAPNTR